MCIIKMIYDSRNVFICFQQSSCLDLTVGLFRYMKQTQTGRQTLWKPLKEKRLSIIYESINFRVAVNVN